jgi:hypothetical protein
MCCIFNEITSIEIIYIYVLYKFMPMTCFVNNRIYFILIVIYTVD